MKSAWLFCSKSVCCPALLHIAQEAHTINDVTSHGSLWLPILTHTSLLSAGGPCGSVLELALTRYSQPCSTSIRITTALNTISGWGLTIPILKRVTRGWSMPGLGATALATPLAPVIQSVASSAISLQPGLSWVLSHSLSWTASSGGPRGTWDQSSFGALKKHLEKAALFSWPWPEPRERTGQEVGLGGVQDGGVGKHGACFPPWTRENYN